MSDHTSDPNWFPQPPPKPLKAPPALPLVFGALVLAVTVVAAIIWLSGSHHSSRKTQPAAATATVSSAAPRSREQAFAECMRGMGANAGSGGRGRFGRSGPSRNFRTAVDVCRSLVQPGAPSPVAPAQTGAKTPPVA
jgi:hypothetical protein